MTKETGLSISAIAVLIGGFIALLYSFYYMQQLSYSIGVYSGISSAIRGYNVINKTNGTSAASDLVAAGAQSATLSLALHLTYVILPFAVLILAIGIIWLFTRSYLKFSGTILLISSIIYLILVALLEFDFSFKSILFAFPIAYIGGFLALAGGLYSVFKVEYKVSLTKRAIPQISINPETPYSNMKLLSNRLMKKLSGDIKILDMHFDVVALDNLMQLIDKNMAQYRQIYVLTKSDRLGDDFEKPYNDFKNELANRKVGFELRVLDPKTAEKQHERILMDDSTAYKIPPLNIINKKSEHVVGINHKEASTKFHYLWSEAKKFENLNELKQ